MQNKIVIIVIITLFLVLAFFVMPVRDGLTGYSIIREVPFLTVEILSINSHYEDDPYCYSTIEGEVVNKGNSDAEGVLISCSVLDKNDEELGKKTDETENLRQGDLLYFSMNVEIKCVTAASGQKYRCNANCISCDMQ